MNKKLFIPLAVFVVLVGFLFSAGIEAVRKVILANHYKDYEESMMWGMSGYAVPHYVIDAPGGGGKIPLLPDYCPGREGNDVLLRNFQGRTFRYPDVAPECS
jgi:L-lysine 2,3-aminomutase